MSSDLLTEAAIFGVGIVFGAGGFYTSVLYKLAKNQADLTGIANMVRNTNKKVDRRWLHMLATSIDTAPTLEVARHYAKLLREDAWEI